MLALILLLLVHWYFSLFMQTFFLHRYASHSAFLLNPFWEKFFYFFTLVFQGPSFLNPRAYAIMHRLHHTHSDTEKDPHSPWFYKNVFAMMWKTFRDYKALEGRKVEVPPVLEKNIPTWSFIDRFCGSMTYVVLMVSIYIAAYVLLIYRGILPGWWALAFVGVHSIMGPMQGAIVNWCGHKYGYRNFDTPDKSRNLFPWDFFLLGELFQNNHHRYGNRPNLAIRWWEVDPTYYVLKIFHWVRIIRLVPVK